MKLEPEDAPTNEEEDADELISLEELSRTYVNLVSRQASDASGAAGSQDPAPQLSVVGSEAAPARPLGTSELGSIFEDPLDGAAITPRGILEAVLFVGRPDNKGITAAEIAGLMRGVEEAEVIELVDELNASYREQRRALEIIDSPDGYRMSLAKEAELVRERFYGRVKQVSLSQSAIDCLALIAYQPGISRQDLDEQRGHSSGGVLNQLVRRQLVEIRRETSAGQSVTRYFPTERLVQLTGLESLEDLPQVQDFD